MKRLVGGQEGAEYPKFPSEKESKTLDLVYRIDALIKTLQEQLNNLEKEQEKDEVYVKLQILKHYRFLLERSLNNSRYTHSVNFERINQEIRKIEREIQQLSAKPETGRRNVATMPLLRLLLIIFLTAQMQAGCSKPFSTEEQKPSQTVNLQEPGNPQKK